MERDWLEARLAEGRSIESIASEVGKHRVDGRILGARSTACARSTRRKHAARGGVHRDALVALIERGLSMREIASEVGLSFSAIQYWLKKYEFRTQPLHYSRRDAEKTPSIFRECPTHGWTDYVRTGARGYYRCPACTTERVAIAAVVSRRSWSRRPVAGAWCAATTRTPARSSSITSIRRQKRFGLAWAASPERSRRSARRRGSACYCARTATRRSRRGWWRSPVAPPILRGSIGPG